MKLLHALLFLAATSSSIVSASDKTAVSISGEDFHINGKPTYAGRTWNGHRIEGLLLNSRMVQAAYDDLNPETAKRWAYPDTGKWDAERNVNEFVAAMPEWKKHGLLAVTVNFQGGSPEGYSGKQDWNSGAFEPDGTLRPDFARRMARVLNAADENGIAVILGYFYFGQDQRLKDEVAVIRATDEATRWVLDGGWRNVLVELNNETNVRAYDHAILRPDRVHELIKRVRETGKDGRHLLAGTSYGGGGIPQENVVRASDFLLLHGNGVKDAKRITEMVKQTRAVSGYRPMPILFNEDDHENFERPDNNFSAAVADHVSWGWFDYRRKGEGMEEGYQSPPVNWGISSDRKRTFFHYLAEITGASAAPTGAAVERPNVLFIAVDDLNHWVGHLGRNKQTKTPNLDRLAKMGVTFTRAYCAAPVCNPSRAALLSGKRPGVTGIYDNNNPFQNVLKPDVSLVMQFKNAGYETLGMGKLWHGGLGWPEQWTATGGSERGGDHGSAAVDDKSIGGIKFGIMRGGDEGVPDTQIADYGIAELGKAHDKPFFVTVGFHKPHMPWNVPQKYYDMHPLAQIELPPVKENDLDDVPAAGVKFAKPMGDHANVLASGRWKEAVQAYLAAISYLDGQVGRVLDAYDKSPQRDRTIICLWGDHGWHLGEKEHWRKFALWEETTRAPFIWVVPGVTRPGGVCDRTVDFMNIYPTLCDLAGIPKPVWVEGHTIRPLLADPAAAWSAPAITTFGQNNHAIRTERWRYIRYADGGEELYDHSTDEYEWTNLAAKSEHAALKAELAKNFPSTNIAAAKGKSPVPDSDEEPSAAGETKAKGRAKRQGRKAEESPAPAPAKP